jgi:hypothetical protein
MQICNDQKNRNFGPMGRSQSVQNRLAVRCVGKITRSLCFLFLLSTYCIFFISILQFLNFANSIAASNSNATKKKMSFLLAFACLTHCHLVMAQPLAAPQHSALMDIYNSIGSFLFAAACILICILLQVAMTCQYARDSTHRQNVMAPACCVVLEPSFNCASGKCHSCAFGSEMRSCGVSCVGICKAIDWAERYRRRLGSSVHC